MHIITNKASVPALIFMLAVSSASSLSAQETASPDSSIVVNGQSVAGPEIKGIITARSGDKLKVTAEDGTNTVIAVNDATRIKSASGLFGSSRNTKSADALLNGLPVTVKTFQPTDGQAGGELVANQITFRNTDFKTAAMIRNGTSQRFDEQVAATEALRGRMGDIDKYNIKSTTNVHFDTGRSELSAEDKAQLCAAATNAQAQENALMLVVGYTDSTGNDEVNQQLSEKRAARVINYLQQNCGWKPYRMLTPTGMAKADPMASNDTAEGKAQNRRVAVNIMVSKSVDGI